MRGLRGWMLVGVCVALAASAGCQSQGTAKRQYNELDAKNQALQARLNQLEEQQAEVAVLQPTGGAGPTGTTGMTSAPARTDLELLAAQIPGAQVVDRGGQTAIRIQGSQMSFASGKATVTTEGKAVLDRVANVLNGQLASRRIIIEGHTDSDPIRKTRNLYSDNYDLGRKRAQSVADELAARGVDRSRITIESFGPDRPVSKNKAENRRVEVVVTAGPSY